MSPDGTVGWYAYLPDGRRPSDVEGPEWHGPREGATIRLMGSEGVSVALWTNEDGLLFDDEESLRECWPLSDALVADLVAWSRAWEQEARRPEHDAEAARLLRALKVELQYRFTFVYRP